MIPMDVTVVFVVLFILFSGTQSTKLILLGMPFTTINNVVTLLVARFGFSVSTNVKFVTLFNVYVRGNIVVVSSVGRGVRTQLPLPRTVRADVHSHVHPMIVATAVTTVNLVPTTVDRNVKSRSRHPLTVIVVNKLVKTAFFTLFVFPLVIRIMCRGVLCSGRKGLGREGL